MSRRRRRQWGTGEEGQVEDASGIRQEKKRTGKPKNPTSYEPVLEKPVITEQNQYPDTICKCIQPRHRLVFNPGPAECNLLCISASFTCILMRCSFADVIQVQLQSTFHRTQPSL